MKIGVVGSADRAVAWEKNLRPHQTVSEVVISSRLNDIGKIDACLIIDESEDKLDILMDSIKAGYHSFFISSLPSDLDKVEKIYHASEESNIILQFSHWPTLAPATQWMKQRIKKPGFIQIVREINYANFLEMSFDLEYYWIDELAFCLKWIDGAVHQIDIKKTEFQYAEPCAIQLFLRFENGATSAIYINTCASENRHQRIAANHNLITNCNALTQEVRLGKQNVHGNLYFEKRTFDGSTTAESSVSQFLKAIQIGKPTPFNGYDAVRLCRAIEKAKKRMVRI